MATPVIAMLGDSITLGDNVKERHAWTCQLDLHADVYPRVSIGNYGVSGDKVAGFHTRYTDQIKGNGYTAISIWGGVNNIIDAESASSIWVTLEALIDECLADGLTVILVTPSPAAGFVSWTAPIQVQMLALRALIQAKTGVTHLDMYALMGDPSDSTILNTDYDYGDGIHYSAVGQAAIAEAFAPVVAELFPAPNTETAGPVGSWG